MKTLLISLLFLAAVFFVNQCKGRSLLRSKGDHLKQIEETNHHKIKNSTIDLYSLNSERRLYALHKSSYFEQFKNSSEYSEHSNPSEHHPTNENDSEDNREINRKNYQLSRHEFINNSNSNIDSRSNKNTVLLENESENNCKKHHTGKNCADENKASSNDSSTTVERFEGNIKIDQEQRYRNSSELNKMSDSRDDSRSEDNSTKNKRDTNNKRHYHEPDKSFDSSEDYVISDSNNSSGSKSEINRKKHHRCGNCTQESNGSSKNCKGCDCGRRINNAELHKNSISESGENSGSIKNLNTIENEESSEVKRKVGHNKHHHCCNVSGENSDSSEDSTVHQNNGKLQNKRKARYEKHSKCRNCTDEENFFSEESSAIKDEYIHKIEEKYKQYHSHGNNSSSEKINSRKKTSKSEDKIDDKRHHRKTNGTNGNGEAVENKSDETHIKHQRESENGSKDPNFKYQLAFFLLDTPD